MKTVSEQGLSRRRTAATAAAQEAERVKAEDKPEAAAKQADSEAAPAGKSRKERHIALRILFWTLRAAIVPIILIAALVGGLYVGYVVLGKSPEEDVWEIETWRHMYDLIFSDS